MNIKKLVVFYLSTAEADPADWQNEIPPFKLGLNNQSLLGHQAPPKIASFSYLLMEQKQCYQPAGSTTEA